MQYRVGQKVRLLHESGDGVITALVDNHHVEVDFGDDFPIEVHIREVIPIDRGETAYLGRSAEVEEEKQEKRIQQLGTSIMELSLVVAPAGEDRFALYVVNPEPVDMLFTCYVKIRGKFEGLAAGDLRSGERQELGRYDRADLFQIKAFTFQVLSFVAGRGYPHSPLLRELPWSKGHLQQPPKALKAIGGEGWVFSLREDPQRKDVQRIREEVITQVRQQDEARPRPEGEVDLHIEELVARPYELAPSEMLRIQTETLEQALSKALAEHYERLIVIHGVGMGVLKNAVREVLKKTPHIKSFRPADPARYGNGATEVIFD
ncbi:MAG: hypothetical protein D6722_15565 [Bacteroidetes bacterium]|nr:MAG: hypothetical protein D6722_15565 [Bacteroidota bacterium]